MTFKDFQQQAVLSNTTNLTEWMKVALEPIIVRSKLSDKDIMQLVDLLVEAYQRGLADAVEATHEAITFLERQMR